VLEFKFNPDYPTDKISLREPRVKANRKKTLDNIFIYVKYSIELAFGKKKGHIKEPESDYHLVEKT
jgi:hypothetical protein